MITFAFRIFLFCSSASLLSCSGSEQRDPPSDAPNGDSEPLITATEPDALCIDEAVRNTVLNLVAKEIAGRGQPDTIAAGVSAGIGEVLDALNEQLRDAKSFSSRLDLVSTTFEGSTKDTGAVTCAASVTLSSLIKKIPYNAQPRISFTIQPTLEGDSSLVTLGSTEQLKEVGFRWARAEQRSAPVPMENDDLGAEKSLRNEDAIDEAPASDNASVM